MCLKRWLNSEEKETQKVAQQLFNAKQGRTERDREKHAMKSIDKNTNRYLIMFEVQQQKVWFNINIVRPSFL